ncbi:MAG TPA: hypothetical protein VFK43_16795, partial [Acidimicrobiales bacterium]|nr:hypothetical protein [Acidimicrobiales bacterium]
FSRQIALELTASQTPLTPESALELAGHLYTATERLSLAVDPRWSETLAAQAVAEARVPAYETALGLLQIPLLPPGATTATAGAGQAGS